MTRVLVVDTETTGVDPNEDKIVEVGAVLIEGEEVIQTYECLVNPGIPIPPKASAVHHLTDEMVASAPSLDAAIQPLLELDFDYVVAHNAKFDMAFLDLGEVPWLCTFKLAHKVWPEAPAFGNQVLRYWLKLAGPKSATHAHRALYDTEVTAQIFQRILLEAQTSDPYPGMLKVSQTPVLLRTVGFGKHFGLQWSEVPRDYLNFMVNKSKGWDEDQLYTAKYWLDRK